MLPDWDRLAVGLNAVVLAPGEFNVGGFHVPGVVAVCAWERDLWREITDDHYAKHREVFARLNVEIKETEFGVLCKFDEPSARAYQLLHILLHELGHHPRPNDDPAAAGFQPRREIRRGLCAEVRSRYLARISEGIFILAGLWRHGPKIADRPTYRTCS